MKRNNGFTLIEIIIYLGILAVATGFLVNILSLATRVQNRELATTEVTQQLDVVLQNIQRYVRESSLIEMTAGQATSTITLRTASSTTDPTLIYSDGAAIYLKQGTDSPVALTTNKVNIGNFSVTKFENPGGHATLQVDLTLNYATSSGAQFTDVSRTLKTAIARVSAATFDSDLIPNADNSFSVGSALNRWQNAYFAGNVGIGTNAPSAKLQIQNGDIYVTTSTRGIILTSPDGTCARGTIDNADALTFNSVTCP